MARLVTLEGDSDIDIVEMLGLDYRDAKFIKIKLSEKEKQYLNNKYPEYMGFLPAIIGAVVGGAISIGKAIGTAVKGKRQDQQAASQAEAAIKAQQEYQMALLEQERKKQEMIYLLVGAGVPLILISILLLTRR